MGDTKDMSGLMCADMNWAQLKYWLATPAVDESISNKELEQLCTVPSHVEIWRSNICFKYFYIYSRKWYQCDMNDLEEHQKDVITKCMLKDWKSFEGIFMDHDRYLRRQRSRRDERIDKFINQRHERRWRKKMQLLANVPDSQASLFLPDTNKTDSLDDTLYEPSTQDFVLPENPHQTSVEDLPLVDPKQEPLDDNTDTDDEGFFVEIQDIQEESSSSSLEVNSSRTVYASTSQAEGPINRRSRNAACGAVGWRYLSDSGSKDSTTEESSLELPKRTTGAATSRSRKTQF